MDKETLIEILGGNPPNEAELLFLKENSTYHLREFYRGIPLHHSLIKKGHVLKEFSVITHWTDDIDIAKWYADIESDNEGCPDMKMVELLGIDDEDIPKEFKPFIMISNELKGFDALEHLSEEENPFKKEREFITVGQDFVIDYIYEKVFGGKTFYFGMVSVFEKQ